MATQTRRRGDTRGDIQRTALRMFNSQGYDKTSLREIAEDLGLTKAALYYHFPTKEDILESLVRDVATSLDELIAWARSGPSTRERRLEFLRRLGAATRGGMGDLMRCVQQNELAVAGMPGATSIVHQYKKELAQAILPPDAEIEGRMR
ncbi:MAG TPA: helix-turn-helix domain-containing protein, partial [Acidimicrobiales bacterium]|nr:helix-turn-helix domain-containing protein [Acidimicrobiales bacterium]